jgi:Tol biopolymer transport system component
VKRTITSGMALALTLVLSAVVVPADAKRTVDGQQWIAYQAPAETGDGDGIFLVRTDGSESHQILADLPGDQIHPDWSPDGAKLAFIMVVADSTEVWVSDADGSHARRVAACTDECLAYDYVAWTPSGRGLLMMRYNNPTVGDAGVPASSSLELLDLSSNTSRDVVRSGRQQLFSAPRVSPDGRSYCVTVEIGDTGAGPTGSVVAVGKMSGGRVRMLTKASDFGSYCDWRPAADEIVYTTHDLSIFPDMSEPSNLYLIRPDGSHLRQITRFAAGKVRATQPRWTPNGQRILFTRVDGDGSLPHRLMASVSPSGGHVEWATGKQPRIGTHPALQPRSHCAIGAV